MDTILGAFITFENEDSYEEAKAYIDHQKDARVFRKNKDSPEEGLLNDIIFKQACEPENIIWESKGFRGWTLYRKYVKAFIWIFLILGLAFYTIIKIQVWA